ncbi:hypothetical protein [Fimbriiglobus ruber]|uniref:Uncharacterized protein n=1 Tax=Fimbriiglobus ruber TaxID=1908690 RepID=A0A225D8B7_9BACT|nr:hypothetical protein [Fimbriiglobus ruber]OWK37830.1 hypothetical protein FRUB_06950 [Fimbriiglobus ruber]
MGRWGFNDKSRFGDRSRFAVEVGESHSDTDAARRVDVWAAGVWLTCDDNNVYVPHFAGCLQHAVGYLLSDPQCSCGRPYPELSVADNYRRLWGGAQTDNAQYLSYRFMHWGPTADNVSMLLFREAGTAYLPFSFCWPVRAELGQVFVAQLPEWELAAVLHDTAWALMWDWADRSRWPK